MKRGWLMLYTCEANGGGLNLCVTCLSYRHAATRRLALALAFFSCVHVSTLLCLISLSHPVPREGGGCRA